MAFFFAPVSFAKIVAQFCKDEVLDVFEHTYHPTIDATIAGDLEWVTVAAVVVESESSLSGGHLITRTYPVKNQLIPSLCENSANILTISVAKTVESLNGAFILYATNQSQR